MRLGALSVALLIATSAEATAQTASAGNDPAQTFHVRSEQVPWTASRQYPDELKRVYRVRGLIGGPGLFGSMSPVPDADILVGELELAPGAIYPAHVHPAPEVYYVVQGRAEWTVGGETFMATAGTAVHTPPGTLHRIANVGDEVVRAVYFWWAPGGDRTVLGIPSTLVEPMPDEPADARFPDR